jgi:hypothetical protein
MYNVFNKTAHAYLGKPLCLSVAKEQRSVARAGGLSAEDGYS